PKNTPVSSSHSTPDSFTNGAHTAWPNRLLPSFTPLPVCRTCEAVRAACSPSRAPVVAASVFPTVEGAPAFADVPAGAGVDGFGAGAASTAAASVLAAP